MGNFLNSADFIYHNIKNDEKLVTLSNQIDIKFENMNNSINEMNNTLGIINSLLDTINRKVVENEYNS